jgi:hypothetical protein
VPRETLWVRLVDETGAPPQGDGRALTEFRRPAERQLLRAPNRPLLRALAWGPWVSAGGRLVLVDPPPWTTDVRVDLGGVGAALALSFDPTPRPAGEELVLEVSSGLTVRGRLRRADGQPLPAFRWGDRAAVHRVQGNTELLGCTGQAVELAPDGSFEFRGLAPGDHYVGVFLGAQQRVELWSLPRPEGAELAFEFDGHELLLEVDPAHGAPALGSLRILATGDLRRHDLLGRIDERVELGEERAPLRLWVPQSDAPLAVIATALDGQLFGPSPAARPDPDRVLLVPIALGSVRFELPDLVPGSFARFHPQLIPLGAGATAWVGSCDLDRFGRAEATGVTPGRYLVYGSLTDGGQMVLLPPYAEITVGARETAETSVRTVRGGRLEVRLEPAAADGFVPEQLESRVEIEPEGARTSLPFGPLFLPGTYRSHRPALQRSGLLAPGLRRMELLGRTGHEVRSLWTEVAIESDRVSTIVLRFEP